MLTLPANIKFIHEQEESVIQFPEPQQVLDCAILGVLIVGFLDENSFVQRMKYELQISDLKSQIEEYNDHYEHDSRQLKELRRNPKAIEKIARERYFMKADDEDIFVLSDDLEPANENGP